jgi:hypothetical protein
MLLKEDLQTYIEKSKKAEQSAILADDVDNFIEMTVFSNSLYELEDIEANNDRRQIYFIIFFWSQFALNVFVDLILVVTISIELENKKYGEEKKFKELELAEKLLLYLELS